MKNEWKNLPRRPSSPKKAKSKCSFVPHFDVERGLLSRGLRVVAGADEAGRGALAGPLSVGFVIFPEEIILTPPLELVDAVQDSKILSPKQRLKAVDVIIRNVLFSDVCLINHRCVDALNINGATAYALKKLITRCPALPEVVIFDGKFSFDIGCELVSIVDGDAICLSVAAASILAKVRRDCVMERLELHYPGYGFAKHKGYGTAAHREIIKALGPCPIHRRSYEPVKSMMK